MKNSINTEKQDYSNQLSKASSPYLRQHSNNPIDWHEWTPKVLKFARETNKPLLISIGYAACHWCHVMAEETFMNQSIADYMNKHFVCIKVDREERPDIDRIYMNAANLLTGSGGWPLNVFTTPDGAPFFAGTYFPRKNWNNLLRQIVDVLKNNPELVSEQAEAISHRLKTNVIISDDNINIKKEDYINLFNKWKHLFDKIHGGFNKVPKFPLPVMWEFLLQYYYLTGNKEVLDHVKLFLNSMSKGGIYDQIGGGFARYSVDTYWKVPHFEKMLYDNGQLVSLYSHAYKITGKNRYSEIVHQTLDFIKREMTSPEGGFYSSLNADSEGIEGKFYTWTEKELDDVLDTPSRNTVKKYYQITPEGNWENGRNILFSKYSINKFAERNNLNVNYIEDIINETNKKLLTIRNKRVRPTSDDKILTSWNAIMLSGYIEAYKTFDKKEYLEIALKNAAFLENNVICSDGKLYRNYKDGKAIIEGFLDDYAFLSEAFIKLYEVTFNLKYLNLAERLIKFTLDNFRDDDSILFYYTSKLSEKLFAKDIEISDNVIPASNSVLANSLLRIGYILNNNTYVKIAEKAVIAIKDNIFSETPYYANWAILAGQIIYMPYEISILGPNTKEKLMELNKAYLPTSIFIGGNEENLSKLKGKLRENQTLIYVCHDKICSEQTENVKKAINQISR